MSRDFNGTTSLIRVPTTSLLNDAEPFTLVAWIYPEGLGENSNGRLMDKADLGTDVGPWRWFITANTALIFTKDYATTDLRRESNTNSFALNRWTHVAVTWDGSPTATNVKMYFNGVEETVYLATTDGSGAKNSDAAFDLRLGNVGNATRTFNGQMAYLGLIRRVLTRDEILSEMHHPGITARGPAGVGTAGYVGFWTLNGQSAVEADASGNRSDGTTLSSVPFHANTPPVNELYGAVQSQGGYCGG